MDLIIKDFREQISSCSDMDQVSRLRDQFHEKYLNPLRQKLMEASPQEKPQIGKKINYLKSSLSEIIGEFKEGLLGKMTGDEKENSFFDFSIENYNLSRYSFNPLSQIRRDLIFLFNNLHFVIESGKEVVTKEQNFEFLCVPEDHPSRSESETFFIDNTKILRPHCTVNSIDALRRTKNKNSPLRIATMGVVYRKDDESTRHTHQFTQLDFLWVDKDLTVGNLKNLLLIILKNIFGKEKIFRFRKSYFPFTQPSFEVDMKCKCDEERCGLCKGSGWIEILGTGMLRKEILKREGYDGDFEALAGGLGLERIAMIKYGIKDIREIYKNRFDFLKDDNK